jgi:hypothetical protein
MNMNTKTMTPDESNDAIRAQVEREIPTPHGGFETDDAERAHRDAHERRFAELVNDPSQWKFD